MYGEAFFYQALIYLTAAVVMVPVAKRLGLGSVLGYLIAGIVIGPFGLDLVGDQGQDVMHFAEFGVVMMLFVIGLELEPSVLWRMRAPILGLGGLQVTITTAAIASIGLAAGLGWQMALAVGMSLALSSTAIVLQTLKEKGLLSTGAGQSSFAVLLFQDIAVIPMLALMPLLATLHGDAAAAHGAAGSTWVSGVPGWAKTLLVLGAVAVIVVGGRFLLRPVFRYIARSRMREIFTAAVLLLVIGIAILMTRVGLSPALGTFLAGVVLANSEYRRELESDIVPFKGLLLGLFFIAIGASIDFWLIGTRPGLIAALVGGLIAVKLAVLFVLARVFRMGLDHSLIFSFALAQGGEFAFVLFSFATQSGVLDDPTTSPLIAAVAVSMALTPLLMLFNELGLLPRVGTQESETRKADPIDEQNPVIIAGFGRFGHIIGRLLTANGIGTTALDFDPDQIELFRKLGIKTFYGDACRHDLLAAAGADQAKLLVVAIDNPEKSVELVKMARKHFPGLPILARARGRLHEYELLEAGLEFDQIYRETLESSLRVGVDAMRRLGFRGLQAHRAARRFRLHDDEMVRELAAMRSDRTALLHRARERIQDVEDAMRAELDRPDRERDAAWDTDTLRNEFGSDG